MGRLSTIFFTVLPAAVLLFMAFFSYLFFSAHITQLEFEAYLKTHNPVVDTQEINDRQQVYYQYKNKRIFVTHDKHNHVGPKSSGNYIAWQDENNGQSQVVLYNLITKKTLQLTYLRNNTAISMDGTLVAWQGWAGTISAIYYFNGQHIKKISGDYAAIRPFVGSGQILFAQQTDATQDIWQTIQYDPKRGLSRMIVAGDSSQAAWPRLEGGEIKAGIEGSGKFY